MITTRSRTYENNVNKDKNLNEAVTKKTGGVRTRRAALGDITNNASKTDGKSSKGGAAVKKVTAIEVVQIERKAEEDVVMKSPVPSVESTKPVVEKKQKSLPADEDNKDDEEECVTYVNDIYEYYRRIESKFMALPLYMDKQPRLNAKMRAILIDWLVEVHMKFKLMPETLYLTVNLIDRYLERKKVVRGKLQLVGVTAMLIASKYEEVYFPEVADFSYITDNAYTRDEILKFEGYMINGLQFNFTIATPLRFLDRFAKGIMADDETRLLANYVCERQLQEIEMLKYTPSMIAASSILIARQFKNESPAWPESLREYTDFSESHLADCVKDMTENMHKKTNLKAVRKKYMSSKQCRVAYTLHGHPRAYE